MNCKICQSSNLKKIFSKGKKGFYLCQNCQIVFQHPVSKKEIEKYYQKQYFSSKKRVLDQFVNWFIKEKHLKNIKLIKKHTTKKKLLDIGTGYGYFVKLALENGFKSQGIEPSKESVKMAKKLFGISLENSFFDRNYRIKEKFDVITAFHVIEHVLDPLDFIKAVYKRLNYKGIFILETPNVQCFNSLRMKKNWPFVLPNEHLFYFSFRSLVPLLEKSGFKILYQKRTGPFIHKKKRGLTKVIRSPRTSLKLKLLSKIYTLISEKLLFGDHLFIVAEKKMNNEI